MADAKHKPKANAPPSAQVLTDADRKSYIINTLDKFIDKYILFDGKSLQQFRMVFGAMQLIL